MGGSRIEASLGFSSSGDTPLEGVGKAFNSSFNSIPSVSLSFSCGAVVVVVVQFSLQSLKIEEMLASL